MERYPVLDGKGNVVAYQVSSAEFTVRYAPDSEQARIFMWLTPEEAIDVTEFVKEGLLIVEDVVVDAWRLIEDVPWPLVYSCPSAEWYAREWLAPRVAEALRGKRVVVNFSGGKDSCATLSVLASLRELVDFKLEAVYSHVTYMELPRGREFAREAAEKLGVELVEVEADRHLMRKRLAEEGLPYRGARWCTFMKLKPVKAYHKSVRPLIVADGDRMAEAYKRFKRLVGLSRREPRVLTGSRLRPVYHWTLLDVVRACREYELVHPDYLEGRARVACLLCPYASLHEISDKDIDQLEDPGLAEEAIRVSFRLRYQREGIPWEDFREQHLWRYHPKLAKRIYEAKRRLAKIEGLERLKACEVNEGYASLWLNPLPRAPVLTPEEALQELAKKVGEGFEKLLKYLEKYGGPA